MRCARTCPASARASTPSGAACRGMETLVGQIRSDWRLSTTAALACPPSAPALTGGLAEGHGIRRQPVMPLHELHFAAEFLRRRMPFGRLDRHRLLDRRAHIGRDPPGTQVRHGRRGDPQIVRDEILVGLALVRGTPGDQRVDRGAEGVHVGSGRRRIPGEHLGCGVGQGAGEVTGHRLVSTGDARGAEVAQLRFAVIT